MIQNTSIPSASVPVLLVFALGFLFLLLSIVRRMRAHSISLLPGPPSQSWLIGNTPELIRPEVAAEADFAWTKKYGSAIRIKGAFGMDILFTSDPKAIQYILNTSGYNFPKPRQSAAIIRLVTGEGIIWAAGTQHARHRKIMNPAFSYSSLRVFLPLFRHTAHRAVSKWNDLVARSDDGSAVIDVVDWLARITLDALGATAFDYDFGALDEADNELSNAFRNLGVDTFFKQPNFVIVVQALWGYLPYRLVKLMQRIPGKRQNRLNNYMKAARCVAKNIVVTQTDRVTTGKEGGKDVMSILIRANLSENPKTMLNEEELVAQLTTLMLAGHETTASTINWALYELSKHPEFQNLLRHEIKQTRKEAAQRGDKEFSVADLDSMKYLLALIKETLRYHPIIFFITREAGRDDVIPLSNPQTARNGDLISSIPVSKGQRVTISISAYNRHINSSVLKSVWGDDADVWRPERFVEENESLHKTNLGVISNIVTFSSGIRGCIGWRFAMIEMQAILIELLENFKFSPAPENPEIIRGASGFMMPMVRGSLVLKAELPLTVTPVA
ncbi:cytochrome P450 [Ramaria rubella]|nr:cytochrome P450 [Ramaria rubella]